MKKFILVIVGILILSVGYWLLSPLLINKEVSERLQDIVPVAPSEVQNEPEILSQGSFAGLAGHSAEGAVKLLNIGGRHYVRFEDNFKVTNGPDLFIYFGKDGNYDGSAQISRLKGNIGGQNYEVPTSLDLAKYNEVWVWCRSFSVPFGKAELK